LIHLPIESRRQLFSFASRAFQQEVLQLRTTTDTPARLGGDEFTVLFGTIDLLHRADMAMYRAKENGKSRCEIVEAAPWCSNPD
jgi:PleD family two-component response regulator